MKQLGVTPFRDFRRVQWYKKGVELADPSLPPAYNFTSIKPNMHFSIASFTSAALLLATLGSALPTHDAPSTLISRDAGPSGSVISPAGDTAYKVGDVIALKYQRVLQTDYAVTSALNVTLRTFDGKVTYNANVINIVQTLAPATEDAEFIEAWLRIPQLAAGYDDPDQSAWVAHLEITETQTGSLGAAPFLAAAPRITVDNA
ncbi:hypothetical protein BCR35DRAFT_326718 [Leucosporidium creatinivorum]|uniref:Uncharacterized protein n=1 Tax=Leucosporidium creatinivorum TaxID=106004 RepID=A0A1Y2DRR0_9BASI|nr:hypothetical protein BCR35DRAFT_326718 [Leucosporidium creatinivorum]